MDIAFYDFDFNLLYILPPFSKDTGYESVNAQIDLNDSGSLEIVFHDEELKRIIEQKRDTILIVWGKFQGFLTSYRWDTNCRITGMSLNGLLHRNVVQANSEAKTVDDWAKYFIEHSSLNEWLTLIGETELKNELYLSPGIKTADTAMQEMLEMEKAGYRIEMDIVNKKFYFKAIKPKTNNLMISEDNLNAYNMSETYINKELSFGGYYEEEIEYDETSYTVAQYATLDDNKKGIYKIDCVLSAKSYDEALRELKKKKASYELTCETRDIFCGEDYNPGDVVRVQKNGITVKKQIIGVKLWNEKGYGEQPILGEWEE